TRSVIAGLILFCINTVIAAIFLVLNLDATNAFLISLCWSIVLAVSGAIKLRLNRQIYNLNSPFLTLKDIVCLALSITVGLSVLAPFISSHSLITLLQIISNSGDNINHLGLIQAVSASHGYLHGSKEQLMNIVSPLFFGYPLGWHVNVVMFGSFWPVGLFHHTFGILYLYYAAFAVTGASLMYLFCLLTLEASKVIQKRLTGQAIFTMAALSIVVWTLWWFDFVVKGFPNFLMVLALMALLIFCLYDYLSAKTRARTLFSLSTSLLVLMAIGTTWLFLLPAAGILTFICSILRLRSDQKIHTSVWQWFYPQLVVWALSVPFLLFQPINQLHYAIKNTINSTGNIEHLDTYLITATFLIAMLVVVFYRTSTYVKLIGLALALCFGYSSMISIYQHATLGYQEYYFYKQLYVVQMLVLILAAPLLLVVAKKAWGGLSALNAGLTKRQSKIVALVLVLVALLVLDSHSFANINSYRKGQLDNTVAASAANIIASTSLTSNDLPVIFVGDCNHANDYLATHLSSTLLEKNDNIQQNMYFGGLFATDKPQMMTALISYRDKRPGQLITIASLDRQLLQDMRAQLGSTNINYLDIDDGNPKTPSRCPLFVH
ncbi:MAG TPA: hypothetical protein VNX65_04670, partial [Patescibacteria group bacterium]|nr:hypothetical protein [Patescibacteria group bacterium]